MQKFGYAVLIVGLIAVVGSSSMDVIIDYGGGPFVDQGLVKIRRQLVILSAIVAAGGMVIALFGTRKPR
jgi:hypothetical protein